MPPFGDMAEVTLSHPTDVGSDEKSSAAMHPLPANDGKEQESAGVTSDVEHSQAFIDPVTRDNANKDGEPDNCDRDVLAKNDNSTLPQSDNGDQSYNTVTSAESEVMTSELSKDEVHSDNQERRNSSQEKPLEEKTDRPTVRIESISSTSEHEDSVCDQSPAEEEQNEKTEPEPEEDRPDAGSHKEDVATDNTDSLGDHPDQKQRNSSQEMSNEKMDRSVENIELIGPTAQHQDLAGDQSLPGSKRFLWAVCLVVVVAILVQNLIKPELPHPKKDLRQIDIFLGHLEKLKGQFPNQRAELWTRSRIHLLRHLQTAQPTEPVSLILTAGARGERTMHCLAHGLASTFSAAHNASVLHIDGASKASQDSDQVKLDIDSKLQVAFEGDKPVAVIHRFEELPPGSTLIFYRYCDHENAAYKRTFLIFTVLLEDEEEIPPKSTLSAVEEMVDDHLQKKFLSGGHPISFDRMDRDKYGGLWSRISHLILPVAADKRMERDGCPWT